MHRRSVAAVLSFAGAAGVMLAAAGTAQAAGSADLSVTQTIAGSATSGHTGDTIAIHNAGPNDASTISVVLLVKTTSNTFSVGISGAPCQFVAPPPGYQFMLTCQSPSLANGATLNLVTDLVGQVGSRFTLRVSIGEGSPGDPAFGNNLSSVISYFGPAADLAMSQTDPVQSTPGQAQVVTNVVNKGPNTANSVQILIEIKSPTFQTAGATGTMGSCGFVAPQPTFTEAISCTASALNAGATWTETLTYTGQSGKPITTVTTVSDASPVDPVSTNNQHRIQTSYA